MAAAELVMDEAMAKRTAAAKKKYTSEEDAALNAAREEAAKAAAARKAEMARAEALAESAMRRLGEILAGKTPDEFHQEADDAATRASCLRATTASPSSSTSAAASVALAFFGTGAECGRAFDMASGLGRPKMPPLRFFACPQCRVGDTGQVLENGLGRLGVAFFDLTTHPK